VEKFPPYSLSFHWTVREIVAVWLMAFVPEPEAAVTVTVPVPAGVPELLIPPQPSVIPAVQRTNTEDRIAGSCSRFFQPINNNPQAAMIPPPANGQGRLFRLLVAAVVVIVIVVVLAAVPFGVTLVGEKLQVASDGRPEQVKEVA
jgi:hypothetical protein